jgi:cell division protein FtsZ
VIAPYTPAMDWIAQNWPFIVVGLLAALIVLRFAVNLITLRSAPRHTGEQKVRVIGVGGAGGNAINEMVGTRQAGVEFVSINTDGQVLERSLADRRIRIGDQVTRGLGAGGDATLGRKAAEEDAEAIQAAVIGADLVVVTAGMGGGTGSGAAPLVAQHARDTGALTIAVTTLPFAFEGTTRRKVAETAVAELRPNVDTLLVIENERVTSLIAEDTPLVEAFGVVNDVLGQTIRAVVDIMSRTGLVNLDFADVRAIMHDGGPGMVGIGRASGADRAVRAAQGAIASPLLALDLHGARGILLHVAGSSRLTLHEVIRAAEVVREAADADANVIFGATFDDHLRDELRVTVIATRFPEQAPAAASSAAPAAARPAAEPGPAATHARGRRDRSQPA